jgi:hypothetical protein
MRELFLQPIHQRFRELVNPGFFRYVLTTHRDMVNREALLPPEALIEETTRKLADLCREIKTYTGSSRDEEAIIAEVTAKLTALVRSHPFTEDITDSETDIHAVLSQELSAAHLAWLFVHVLGDLIDGAGIREEVSRSWIDEWLFGRIIGETLVELGYEEKEVHSSQLLIKIFTTHQRWCEEGNPRSVLMSLMADGDVQYFLEVNRYQGVLWFSKEAFEDMIAWMHFTAGVSVMSREGVEQRDMLEELRGCFKSIDTLHRASLSSGYQLEKLMTTAKENDR